MMLPSTSSAAGAQSERNVATEPIRVAFQGELGAYGDQAILQHWQNAAIAIPSASFEHVVADIAWGLADYGVVPVWNTVVGEITAGCVAVRIGRDGPYHLAVFGDVHVVVRHQLLSLPGTTLDDMRSVASHPVALAQCGRFLEAHPNIASTPVYDTAGAARDLAMNGTRTACAIAGSIAAKRYGLSVLKEDIQDVPDNVTHFLVLGQPAHRGDHSSVSQLNRITRW